MGRPYSLDLRERVVALSTDGGVTQQEIADQLNLGVATVGRWCRRARKEGSAAAYPGGRGPEGKIQDKQWAWIEEILRSRPDASMQEVAWELEERHGFSVSRSTVGKEVRRRGWTLKKNRSGHLNRTIRASKSSASGSKSDKPT